MRHHCLRLQPLLAQAPSARQHCCGTPSRLARSARQSIVGVLEWLAYEENRLPHEDLEERIKHARNGGEKAVKTSFQKYLAPTYQLKVTLESKRRIKVFWVITPNGFEHVYQTVVFPVHEFVAGSTRLDTLAGNSIVTKNSIACYRDQNNNLI